MSEHSKIPAPEVPKRDSPSLLERASGTFGFDPFKPAPLPRKVQDEAARRAPAKPVPAVAAREQEEPQPEQRPQPAPQVEPAPSAPPAAPVAENPEPAAQEPVAKSAVRQPAIRRTEFSGPVVEIDRAHLREQGLIVPEGPVTGLIEEFRIVKRQLLGDARHDGTGLSRRILICSPHPGEGKTYCASNLAISLSSERDSEVLLIDADFAKPSILAAFGISERPGLMDCLADPDIAPEDLVIRTDIPGLFILPAGQRTNSDSEYLASARTAEVLDRLTRGAPDRMVLFDTPPALAASPAAELAGHVGKALLVARADVTAQSALEDAVDLLSACPDIQLLLNATHFSPSGRRFGTYYEYGGDQ